MKKKPNRIIPAAVIVAGLFLSVATVAFLLPSLPSLAETTHLVRSLIAGAAIALLSTPFMLWLSLRKPSPRDYSGYALEELDLSEEELADAVGNWVFANHGKRMEEDLRFLEDDDGNVSCRVTVRKD